MQIRMRYALIPAGAYGGMPALWIAPGSTQMPIEGMKAELEKAFTTMNMYAKIVVFDVREQSFPEEEIGEVTKLLDWALDEALPVHFINAKEWPSYVRMGGVIKSYVYGNGWLPVRVHELYWVPTESDPEEPELDGYEKVVKYVVLNGKFGVRSALQFLYRCEKTWGIVNPPKREVEIVIYE